ncbi:MAG TPA: tetratricopeptide repeat protein [Puia sp.]|jgi:tetratricopeptide (TPR) repeat protein|nr:tetratricopeptide repeat protein [Puia sp.]
MSNRIIVFLLTLGIVSGCKNAEDYFSEGQDLSLDGHYEAAIVKYNLAIQSNQYLKDSYIQMGICYEYLNQHDSALKSYNALLKIFPENTAANYYAGISKYRQQKYAEAIPYYDRALDSKGGFHASDTNSIQTLIDLCKDNFESENAEIDIPSREILYDRAMARYKSGKFKSACDDFSNCILQNYNPGTSYYMIGLCRLARKEMTFARKAFFQASNYGDSLAIKKLSFLENPNGVGHNLVRKKA